MRPDDVEHAVAYASVLGMNEAVLAKVDPTLF